MSLSPKLGGRATPRAFAAVTAYAEVAKKHGLSLAHMALAWQRSRPFKVSAIFGATTTEQLNYLLEGKDIVLTQEVLDDIETVHRAHPMPY